MNCHELSIYFCRYIIYLRTNVGTMRMPRMESRLGVAVLVAVVVAGGGVAAAKLKPCEQAIYYCCDPETNSALPLKSVG